VRLDRGVVVLAGQTLAIAAVGVLAGLLVWKLTHQPPPPRVGERAPAFSLQRLNGAGPVSLASLRGKIVVLNFFASWCAPCKREAPVLEKVWQDYRSRGVVVLGVDSGDEASDARRFMSAHGVTYPVVVDQNESLAKGSYALLGFPTTYVLNRAGRVVGPRVSGPVSDSGYSATFNHDLAAALKS
jgi:cytochrome c biogenesis protein CcmG, thiol:disulfide interchange protein DsbE